MTRTLLVSIAGIVLGVALFMLMLRSCSTESVETSRNTNFTSEVESSGRQRPSVQPFTFSARRQSLLGSDRRGPSVSEQLEHQATGYRADTTQFASRSRAEESRQLEQDERRARIDALRAERIAERERRAEQRREEVAKLTERNKERVARRAAQRSPTQGSNIGVRTPQLASTSRQPGDAVTDPDIYEIRNRFQEHLADQIVSSSSRSRSRSDSGAAEGDANNADSNGQGQESDSAGPGSSAGAASGAQGNGSGSTRGPELPGQSGGGGGSGGGNSGPAAGNVAPPANNIPDPTFASGLGSTGFGSGGLFDPSPFEDNPIDNGFPPGTGQPPVDTGGGGLDAPDDLPPDIEIPIDPDPAVIARWAPVEVDGCADLQDFRTADLYLGFNDPALVLVVTADPALGGLRIDGGTFFQDTSDFGSNGPANPGLLAFAPCLAADSFLTLGDATPNFTPGFTPDPNDWGETLSAIWFTIEGAAAIPEPTLFDDGRLYVRVARITTGGDNVTVQGALLVNFINLANGGNGAEFVPIENCDDCWDGATGGSTLAELESIGTLSSPRIPGGATTTGVVTLSAPAPPAGARIVLRSSDPDIAQVPPSVNIPGGRDSVTFQITTFEVDSRRAVTITAFADAAQESFELIVLPRGVATLTFNPPTVLAGAVTTGTITLDGPAPETGLVVNLIRNANSAPVAAPATLAFAPGQISKMFQVKTTAAQVAGDVTLLVGPASSAGATAFGSFVIESARIGDLNGDGVVNGADLASLLGSWGPCPPAPTPCPADFNGDGVVNARDQAYLLGSWGEPPADDDPDDPDDDDDTGALAIARWIEIDNSSCEDLQSFRTADLYLGFVNENAAPVINSSLEAGITVVNGAFFQAPTLELGGNRPPPPGTASFFPCTPFDSFLTISGLNPLFTPGGAPDVNDWGPTLMAEWTTFDIGGIQSIQDPARFGDDRFYLWIGRFTAESAATISGQLTVFAGINAGVINVPAWTQVFSRGMDVNGDGAIDSSDVGVVAGMVGTENARGDLNSDGVVTGLDLRMILDAARSL